MGLLKGVFKFGLVVGAAVGIGYLAERALLAKLQEHPDPDPQWRPATPDGETARVGTADGTSLRAVRAGSGPPIVLIHGLMVPIDVWSLIFSEFVEAGHEIIAGLVGPGVQASHAMERTHRRALEATLALVKAYLDSPEV